MENKETINLYITEAIAINNIFNEAKFGDLNIETISSLLEFKFELSKINKDKDEYIKSVVDDVKTDEFKELSEKEDKSDEDKEKLESLTKELDRKINDILVKYYNQTVDVKLSKIDKNEFYAFCKANSFTITVIEFLYNKIVK